MKAQEITDGETLGGKPGPWSFRRMSDRWVHNSCKGNGETKLQKEPAHPKAARGTLALMGFSCIK